MSSLPELLRTKFYTPTSAIDAGYFTASNSTKPQEREVTYHNRKQGHTTRIYYGGERMPSLFHFKCYTSTQFFYSQLYPNLQETLDRAYYLVNVHKEKYEQEQIARVQKQALLPHAQRVPIRTKRENFNDLDLQLILINALDQLQDEQKIEYTTSSVNELLGPTKMNSKILAAYRDLNATTIRKGSSLYLADQKKKGYLETENIPILSSQFYKDGGMWVIISKFNAFDLWTLLHQSMLDTSMDTILSFVHPIAGLAYNYLQLRLFGTIEHAYPYFSWNYNDFCAYMKIQKQSHKSRIKQQIETGFDELVTHQLLDKWDVVESGLFGFEIQCYPNLYYYVNYIERKSPEIIEGIDRMGTLLSGEDHDKIDRRVLRFLRLTGIKPGHNDYDRVFSAYKRYCIYKRQRDILGYTKVVYSSTSHNLLI